MCYICGKLLQPLTLTFYFIITMLLTDLWSWKTFQQCLFMWWIFVSSFIQIPPLNTEISYHTKQLLTDRQTGQTDGRKHNAHCYWWRHKNSQSPIHTWLHCHAVHQLASASLDLQEQHSVLSCCNQETVPLSAESCQSLPILYSHLMHIPTNLSLL